MKKDLVLIGAGGHCISCIDVIESAGEFRIVGILDKPENIGKKILNYAVMGTDADIAAWVEKKCYFLITLGQVKTAEPRKKIWENLKKQHALIATVAASTSHVSKYARVGEGTIIMHKAVVNAAAIVGEANIINTLSLVEHGAQLGSFCHLSTGAVLNGDVIVGAESFIGSNSIIEEGAHIPTRTLISAGTFHRRSRE